VPKRRELKKMSPEMDAKMDAKMDADAKTDAKMDANAKTSRFKVRLGQIALKYM
jgi:hypothetical protein